MLAIIFRTVLVYILLVATMRLMGKRQLGELEISELVTTLLVSEIASLPIVDKNIPLVYAIIPLVTVLTLEVTQSMILVKFPKLKGVVSTRPSVLIRRGKLDQKEMQRLRISLDELISEVRQAGVGSLKDVDYAILEQNGKLSILPFEANKPITPAILGKKVEEAGIMHALIVDGKIAKEELEKSSFSEENLYSICRRHGAQVQDVLLCGVDDAGHVTFILKEKA